MALASGSFPGSLKSTTPPSSLNQDGYDIEIFVETPSETTVCPYCSKVIRSPHQIECGHRYCHHCINKILSDSEKPQCCVKSCKEPINKAEISRDHAARREIENMKVYCDLKRRGCTKTMKLKDLGKHQQECGYTLIDCIHKHRGCSAKIERRQLTEHLNSECQYRQIMCKFCGESTTNEDLRHHLEVCRMAPVACPNNCGVKNLPRQELEQHLEKCPLQQSSCHFNEYGCEFRGTCFEVQDHISHSANEHLLLVKSSHSRLELKYTQLDRRFTEMENQKSIMENRFRQMEEELLEEKEKVKQLQEKVTKLEGQSNRLEDKVKDAHKIVATQIDKMMTMEHDLKQRAKKDDVEECKRIAMAVQETCRRIDDRVDRFDRMENERLVRSGSGAHAADIEEMRKTLQQIGTQLGMHDVRLAEQDLRFQVLETACYDGVLIWKIKDYTRRKHEAVVGKTLSLYSQPFYTSKYGYKMCARVYLNGDGMGKGTHMSLFFVVMKGDYDSLLTWPFRQKVTLVLLDQDTGRRNLSDTFRPDPTSTSFKRPTSDMNIASGCPLFVSQSVLETPTYVKNDTLYIKVIVDTADLYGP
ncbi:TNF receptor-associated factor 3-like [Ptychodera flava]|uniref:TNF receptor-associated factor 3-like n=1 Tax=Ptychodera flava TaxID=63121 RepID=UPI003969DDD8